MAKVDVFDKTNNKSGSVVLSDKVFATEVNDSLIYYAVKHYLAKARLGTASTKTRSEVRGGGRKPWRQKGTGRARVGTIRNPIWKGGGIVFGPRPRSYDYHMPKKMIHGAIRSVLSQRFKEKKIVVLDELKLDAPKTREIVDMVKAFNKEGKFLVVDDRENKNLMLSVRNIADAKALGGYGVNVYDLLKYDNLFLTKKGLKQIEEVYGK
jgi:large subunit ribosomal protein L4